MDSSAASKSERAGDTSRSVRVPLAKVGVIPTGAEAGWGAARCCCKGRGGTRPILEASKGACSTSWQKQGDACSMDSPLQGVFGLSCGANLRATDSASVRESHQLFALSRSKSSSASSSNELTRASCSASRFSPGLQEGGDFSPLQLLARVPTSAEVIQEEVEGMDLSTAAAGCSSLRAASNASKRARLVDLKASGSDTDPLR